MPREEFVISIDAVEVAAARGETVLAVCRRAGKRVPSLCHHDALEPYASCRLCLVEIPSGGATVLVPSCHHPATPGLAVLTDSPAVRQARKVVLELLLARCPSSAAIRDLAAAHGVTTTPYATADLAEKCVLCGLCVRACGNLLKIDAVGFAGRGVSRRVTPPFNEPSPACMGCGACASICPTGNITALFGDSDVRLAPWDAAVQLASCTRCGSPVASVPLLERARAGLDRAERRGLCLPCLREFTGRDCAAMVSYPSPGAGDGARRIFTRIEHAREKT